MNGKEFKELLLKLFGYGGQTHAAHILDVNDRTVRRWCEDNCVEVPAGVVEEILKAAGHIPNSSFDKFIIGRALGGLLETYLIHTEFPRFACVVDPASNVSDDMRKGKADLFARGNRVMHTFLWFDRATVDITGILEEACKLMDKGK